MGPATDKLSSSVSSDRSNISSLSSTLNSLQSLGLSRHLSFVHYNVQSIVPKLDIIMAELSEFDILSFVKYSKFTPGLDENVYLYIPYLTGMVTGWKAHFMNQSYRP